MPCLEVIIAHRFTCGERKISYSIKKSQNIMKVVVVTFKNRGWEVAKQLYNFLAVLEPESLATLLLKRKMCKFSPMV